MMTTKNPETAMINLTLVESIKVYAEQREPNGLWYLQDGTSYYAKPRFLAICGIRFKFHDVEDTEAANGQLWVYNRAGE